MTRRVKTHIRLGIQSLSPSDQSPRCMHEETFGPYLPIAKFRGVFCKISRSFSSKLRGENPRRNKLFLFFSAKKIFRARGVPRRNAKKKKKKKKLFSWADLYILNT